MMTLDISSPSASGSGSSSSSPLPEVITIGVLALQGAFIEHLTFLSRLRPSSHTLRPIAVRSLPELQSCHALIIPGGESTVIQLVASNTPGLLEGLQAFVRDPQKAVWGTCAGMILMADEDGIGGGKVIKGREQKGWGGIPGLKVWRNLYGTQLDSFECGLSIPVLSNPSKPFNTIFIRAPAVHSLPPSPSIPIEVLSTLPEDRIAPPPPDDTKLGPANPADLGNVMLRQGKKLVTSFHPELSGDVRIHEYWVEACVLGRK